MKFRYILCIITSYIFFNFHVKAKEVSSVYGKILTSGKTVLALTSPFFVTFEHKGKLLAYPINTNSRVMAQKIKSFVDKDALLEGELKKTTFKADGQVYSVETFIPKSIRPLELSALGQVHWIAPERPMPYHPKDKKKESSILILETNNPYEAKLHPTRGPKPGVVGFRINDSVANGLIFTGAAAMIGSQLLKK